MLTPEECLARANELMLVDDVRHPIVKDDSEEIGILAGAFFVVITTPPEPDIPAAINLLRIYLETAFVLGYHAGQESTQDDLSLWENALDK